MDRTARYVRCCLLTAGALAAVLIAKQGRDYKALAGIVCALSAVTAAATLLRPVGSAAALRRCLPSRARLATLWTLTAIPVAAYAIVQNYGLDPVEEFSRFHSADRPFSTFGNPDFLGAFLAFLLPIQLGKWKAARGGLPGRPYLAVFAVLALILIWTESRGAWLGALAGLALWLATQLARHDWKAVARFWLSTYILTRIAVITLLLGVLALTGIPHDIRTALTRRTDRIMLWEGTLKMIRTRPVTGWGPGRFAAEYPPFAPPAFAQRMKDDNTFAEHPHSEYLHLWVETGAIGLGLFLWLVAIIVRQGGFLARTGHPVAAGLLGGLVAILVHIAVDRNFRLASTAVPFWTAAASLWSRRSAPLAAPGPSLPLSLVAVGFALAFGAYTFRPLLASYRVEREGDFLKQAADVPAAELERRGVALQRDPQYWIALGNARAKERDFPRAAEAFRRSLALDPASEAAANNLGNCYFMMSRFEEAGAVYRGMLARDPRHRDARFNLAFTYYHQRRIKEALAEVRTLLAQDPANAKALALKAQLAP